LDVRRRCDLKTLTARSNGAERNKNKTKPNNPFDYEVLYTNAAPVHLNGSKNRKFMRTDRNTIAVRDVALR
jgi:hypothetical protein